MFFTETGHVETLLLDNAQQSIHSGLQPFFMQAVFQEVRNKASPHRLKQLHFQVLKISIW